MKQFLSIVYTLARRAIRRMKQVLIVNEFSNFTIFLYTSRNKLLILLIGFLNLHLVFDDSGYFVLYATMLGIKGKFMLTKADLLN